MPNITLKHWDTKKSEVWISISYYLRYIWNTMILKYPKYWNIRSVSAVLQWETPRLELPELLDCIWQSMVHTFIVGLIKSLKVKLLCFGIDHWNYWGWELVLLYQRHPSSFSVQLLAQLEVGRSRFSWPGPDSISSTRTIRSKSSPVTSQTPLVVESFTVPRSWGP